MSGSTWLMAGLCALMLVVVPLVIHSASIGVYETWDTFDDLSGWARSDTSVSLTNPDQALRIRFGQQFGPPVTQEADIYADVSASGGVFTGNYSNDFVTYVQFDFLADDQVPSSLALVFYSQSSDTKWLLQLPSPTVGLPGTYTVPFQYETVIDGDPYWWVIPGGGRTEAQFIEDLQDVTWIGIYIRRHGNTAAQVYHLDNFVLGGTPFSDPRETDADGDGMTDWEEAIAGTDPDNRDSYLSLAIDDIDGGVRLSWDSVSGRTYHLQRHDTLMDGEEGFTTKKSGITATPPKNEEDDTDSADGPRFYLLKVQKQ